MGSLGNVYSRSYSTVAWSAVMDGSLDEQADSKSSRIALLINADVILGIEVTEKNIVTSSQSSSFQIFICHSRLSQFACNFPYACLRSKYILLTCLEVGRDKAVPFPAKPFRLQRSLCKPTPTFMRKQKLSYNCDSIGNIRIKPTPMRRQILVYGSTSKVTFSPSSCPCQRIYSLSSSSETSSSLNVSLSIF